MLDFCHLLWYVVVLQEVANFMDIIKELWYGNVAPFEQCTRGDKQLKELLKLVARNKEELDVSLTDKQKETLEKFEENLNEMHGIAERDAFSYGLRLGIRLMAEAHLRSSDQRKVYPPQDRPRGLPYRRLRLRDRP